MRFPAVLRVILPFPSLPPQMEQLSYFVASRKSTLSNILLPNLRCFFLRLLLLSLESASINEDKYKVFSQDIEYIYIKLYNSRQSSNFEFNISLNISNTSFAEG